MSHNAKAGAPPTSVSTTDCLAMEASVRKLIAEGKSRSALETAKQFHKAQASNASEGLLVEAYLARIRSLLDQNFTTEAKSLIDIVRERFAGARERLAVLMGAASAQGGELAGLLQPLSDPQLSSERRLEIEQIVQTKVANLAGIADCAALPPENPLRQAAGALDRAFTLVTAGSVTDEQIALPEVSHRSPLAPWKVLVRAIACLYRGEDEACKECLAAIKPESVPARLVPAIRAMLGVRPAEELKPVESSLVSSTSASLSEFRRVLADLDREFAEDEDSNRIYKSARAAVQECQRSAPELLIQLRQLIFVRGGVACVDLERLTSAIGGAPRQDAAYFRLYAQALERTADPEDIAEACEQWDNFRAQAVREGWFPESGVEAATLYLHMAEILGRIPSQELQDLRHPAGPIHKKSDERYFLYPEKLYARACELDPHREAFAQWLRWAIGQSESAAGEVGRQWHQALPGDLEPLLYLMEQSAKRNAFPTALGYLEKAERIDAVHSRVRAARLQLLANGALRHLEQKKPHLATEKLAAMEALPQSRQGDRPALLAALRHLIALVSGDRARATETLREVETLLGGGLAAMLLLFGVSIAAKRKDAILLPPIQTLNKEQRGAIPVSIARAAAIAADFGITKFKLPIPFISQAEAQLPRVRDTLDVPQLRTLADVGMASEQPTLTWAAARAGLGRGGPAEAFFLLMLAKAIPRGHARRYVALAASAATLGRLHGEMNVVDQALEIVRDPAGGDSISLTLDQAREVVRRELTSVAYPTLSRPGPDYSDLLQRGPCQCPDCRRRRGETIGPFDDLDDDDDGFDDGFDDGEMNAFPGAEIDKILGGALPKGMPKELAKMFADIMKEAFLSGKSPEEVIAEVLRSGGRKGRKKR